MLGREPLRVLCLGDIIGNPGRQALKRHLKDVRQAEDVHFVVANGENASGGLGLRPEEARELLDLPIDVVTSGNHIWKHKELRHTLDVQPRLLRPSNYPEGAPGRGAGVFTGPAGLPIGVLNLEGQLFMSALPCPFRTAEREIEQLRQETNIILVDFHAEATSEKRALGFFLDGRISALVGTHTHVPTADAQVLPDGTGYITDLGMCGPTDSVIGVRKEEAIDRFLTKRPSGFQIAKGPVTLQGAVIEVDPITGHCLSIQQRAWPFME